MALPDAPRRLVLASASPARLRLLTGAGFSPEVIVSGVDEDGVRGRRPAGAGRRHWPWPRPRRWPARPETAGAVVVGCDSLLDVDGGGPRQAGGEPTRPGPGSSVSGAGRRSCGPATASSTPPPAAGRRRRPPPRCVFGPFTDPELDAYLATGEPLHVAGAFTLDGRSAPFVERIIGDHGNVIGLSLPLVPAPAGRDRPDRDGPVELTTSAPAGGAAPAAAHRAALARPAGGAGADGRCHHPRLPAAVPRVRARRPLRQRDAHGPGPGRAQRADRPRCSASTPTSGPAAPSSTAAAPGTMAEAVRRADRRLRRRARRPQLRLPGAQGHRARAAARRCPSAAGCWPTSIGAAVRAAAARRRAR